MIVQYVARDAAGAVKGVLIDHPETRSVAAAEMARWRRQGWRVAKETAAQTNRTPTTESR